MLGVWDYPAQLYRPCQLLIGSERQVQHGLNARIPHEVLLQGGERERGQLGKYYYLKPRTNLLWGDKNEYIYIYIDINI